MAVNVFKHSNQFLFLKFKYMFFSIYTGTPAFLQCYKTFTG